MDLTSENSRGSVDAKCTNRIFDHCVRFFKDESFLADSIAQFAATGLEKGAGVLIIATSKHIPAIENALLRMGIDVEKLKKEEELTFLVAEDTLPHLMTGDRIDEAKFDFHLGALVTRLSKKFPHLYICGEMVGLLWKNKNPSATITLEKLWIKLGRTHSFTMLCGYSLNAFAQHEDTEFFREICEAHTHVLPSESFLSLETKEDQLRAVALLEQQALSLQAELKRRENTEHQRTEEKFRLIVESVKDYAIFMLDPQGIVTTWNRGARGIKGYDADEIVGQHFSQFYPLEDKDWKPKMELEVASKVGRFEDEGWRVKKDGTKFWANVVITAVRDSGDKLLGFAKVTRDLTERKVAEENRLRVESQKVEVKAATEERDRLFSLFMQAPVPISVFKGPEHVVELFNPTAQSFIGNRNPTGRPYKDALPELVEQGHLEIVDKVYRSGETVFLEGTPIKFTSTDGTSKERYFNVIYQAWKTKNGEINGVLSIALDVTSQISALKAKDEFLSIASHELKTPLTSLKFQSQIRSREIKRGDFSRFSPDNLSSLIAEDEKQINRLIRLVDDMLDASRIRSGNFSIAKEELDLSELVKDTLNRFSDQIKSYGNRVEYSAGNPVVGFFDRFRIEQVFINLLTNALKYGAKKPIKIQLVSTDGGVRLSVQDHGLGIAKEDQKRIFEKFERAVSATSISGIGIGLFISKKIVEAHKGSIQVQSEPGKGSTFIVDLPLGSMSAETEKQGGE